MLNSTVYLTWPFRTHRMELNLSPIEQKRFRQLLFFEPTAGNLIYPTTSVRLRHPKAGLYERWVEARNKFGFPTEVGLQWLFLDKKLPLYALNLLAPQQRFEGISEEFMQSAESSAMQISTIFAKSRT